MEHLSDASFLGKLLVLPANIRLDWKEIATSKHSILFGLVVSDKEKSFITLTLGGNVTNLFSSSLAETKKVRELVLGKFLARLIFAISA